jgi:hypothetical protein
VRRGGTVEERHRCQRLERQGLERQVHAVTISRAPVPRER